MTPITFEDLTPSTQEDVRQLILDGLGEHWGVVDESLNPDLDDLLTSYRSGRTIVARNGDGSIVGTGTVAPRSGAMAEVVRMSVHPDSRRSGVGRRILNELVATARAWGCRQVVLETTSAWSEVVDFYLRCGFRITHAEEGDFGSDTWFALDLSPGAADTQDLETR